MKNKSVYGFFKIKLNELCILQNNRPYSDEEKQMLKYLESLENKNKVLKALNVRSTWDEKNNFYEVLKEYEVSACELFDQEIYDLLKARLDKEVIENEIK